MSEITPKNSKYTPEQKQAIQTDHPGIGNLLVSASAGSGKTRVLVERVIRQLLDPTHPVRLDHLVIVTFTELAAREMKARIEQTLGMNYNAEVAGSPRARFIQEQLMQLPNANIQTIDAFCRQIVERYYYLIHLDPNFRMMTDETSLSLLSEEVWEQLVLEILSDTESADYEDYVTATVNFSDGSPSKETALQEIITSLYHKSRSHPHPKAWLDQLLIHYPTEGMYGESDLFNQVIRPELKRQLEEDLKPYRELLASYQETARYLGGTLEKNYDKLTDTLAQYDQLVNALGDPAVSYATLYQDFQSDHLQKFAKPHAVKDPNTEEKMARNALGEAVSALNDVFEPKYYKKNRRLDDYLGFSDQTQTDKLTHAYQVAKALVHLTQRFFDRMNQAMTRERVMDFAGIELAALDILESQNAEGVYEARDYYQETMAEILIDEYQDVNALQEAIMVAISREDNPTQYANRFMVGDVKQSIYRFRFSDPTLFQEKYTTYPMLTPDIPANQQAKIVLKENFRSRREVLNFINVIFDRLMDRQAGGVDYREEARLIPGNQEYEPDAVYSPELYLVDATQTDPDEENEDKERLQAQVVAERIQQLMQEGFTIYDRDLKQLRPLRYQDIAILSNTRSHYLALEQIFNEWGIPLEQDKRENFFKRTEIMTMVAIFHLIDNPKQDIPLATLLRSPLIQMSEPEMAVIRATYKHGYYYEAVDHYYHEGSDLKIQEKLNRLFTWLRHWRTDSQTKSLSALIWRIYQETGYLDYVAGQKNGAQRQANLFALLQQSEDFETNMGRGLFQFVRYIEETEKHQQDLATPQILAPDSDAVQLISVHGSKGLEFPVVFYFNAHKRFNLQDINASWIVSDHYGLGVKNVDHTHLYSYTNPLLALAKRDEQDALLAEEMRKLYVALTRAEQKLIIVGVKISPEHYLTEHPDVSDRKGELLSDHNRLNATATPLDWILESLAPYWSHQSLPSEEETFLIHYGQDPLTKGVLQMRWFTQDQILNFKPQRRTMDKADTDTSPILLPNAVKPSPLTMTYPYQAATMTESNQSVSEWKRRLYESEDERVAPWNEEARFQQHLYQKTYQEQDFPAPKFLNQNESTRPSARERGTGAHLLMQKIDLKTVPTVEDFRSLAATLKKHGELTEGQVDETIYQHLADFFDPTLARERPFDISQRLLHNESRLERERPFAYQKPTAQISNRITASQTNDPVLIRGIIDGFFQDEAGEWWLFDYKTDHLRGLNATRSRALLLERYQTQLALYREALSTILRQPIAHTVIVSLDNLMSYEYHPDELERED